LAEQINSAYHRLVKLFQGGKPQRKVSEFLRATYRRRESRNVLPDVVELRFESELIPQTCALVSHMLI
jgi:hypothetical protein